MSSAEHVEQVDSDEENVKQQPPAVDSGSAEQEDIERLAVSSSTEEQQDTKPKSEQNNTKFLRTDSNDDAVQSTGAGSSRNDERVKTPTSSNLVNGSKTSPQNQDEVDDIAFMRNYLQKDLDQEAAADAVAQRVENISIEPETDNKTVANNLTKPPVVVDRTPSIDRPTAPLATYQMRGNGWLLYNFRGTWLTDLHVKSAKHLEEYPLNPKANASFLLCSYPRSGTTWLKTVISALFSPQINDAFDKNVHNIIPCLEDEWQWPWKLVQSPESKRFSAEIAHTHLPMSLWPPHFFNNNVNVIYMYRNIKDTVLSNYHFLHGVRTDGKGDDNEVYTATLPDLVHEYAHGTVWYGPYDRHITDAIKYGRDRMGNRFLLLNYDHVMKTERLAVMAIRNFMLNAIVGSGDSKSAAAAAAAEQHLLPTTHSHHLFGIHLHSHDKHNHVNIDFPVHSVEEVVPIVSFDNMKNSHANQLSFEPQKWDSSNGNFIRRAIVGGWRDEMSESCGLKLDSYLQEAAAYSGGIPSDVLPTLM